jgi:hypothetical protein
MAFSGTHPASWGRQGISLAFRRLPPAPRKVGGIPALFEELGRAPNHRRDHWFSIREGQADKVPAPSAIKNRPDTGDQGSEGSKFYSKMELHLTRAIVLYWYNLAKIS